MVNANPVKLTLEIERVTVVRPEHGPDYIFMTTTLPDGCWPYTGKQSIRMEVAYGTAEDYLMKHFGVKPDELTEG